MLPDDQGRRAVGLEGLGGQLEILVAQHASRFTVDVGEPEREDVVQHVVLEHGGVPVGVLLDEGDVDDADDVVVDQLRHGGHDLALEPVAREPDDDVLDRSHADLATSSSRSSKSTPASIRRADGAVLTRCGGSRRASARRPPPAAPGR
jgi:hypothetical protein